MVGTAFSLHVLPAWSWVSALCSKYRLAAGSLRLACYKRCRALSSVFFCTTLTALFTGLCLHATYSLHMIAKQSWKGFCSPPGSCMLKLPACHSPCSVFTTLPLLLLKDRLGNGNSFWVSQCSCQAKLLEWLCSLYGRDRHAAGIACYI